MCLSGEDSRRRPSARHFKDENSSDAVAIGAGKGPGFSSPLELGPALPYHARQPWSCLRTIARPACAGNAEHARGAQSFFGRDARLVVRACGHLGLDEPASISTERSDLMVCVVDASGRVQCHHKTGVLALGRERGRSRGMPRGPTSESARGAMGLPRAAFAGVAAPSGSFGLPRSPPRRSGLRRAPPRRAGRRRLHAPRPSMSQARESRQIQARSRRWPGAWRRRGGASPSGDRCPILTASRPASARHVPARRVERDAVAQLVANRQAALIVLGRHRSVRDSPFVSVSCYTRHLDTPVYSGAGASSSPTSSAAWRDPARVSSPCHS